MKDFIDKLNTAFNRMPLKRKRKTAGLLTAATISTCLAIIAHGFNSPSPNYLPADKITLPTEIVMPQSSHPSDELLIPIGKMKGMIDDEFESFYLAIDRQGQSYINRNPDYDSTRYQRSNGWEPISRTQLKEFESKLHFIPIRKRIQQKP